MSAKGRPGNGDPQVTHGGEVRQAAMARRMVLREEHFLGRALQRAPVADVPLQGAQHPVRELVGVVLSASGVRSRPSFRIDVMLRSPGLRMVRARVQAASKRAAVYCLARRRRPKQAR